MENLDEQFELVKARHWVISARWRIPMAISIFVALYLGEPYSNFILGALAGILLHPVVEIWVYALLKYKH